MSNEDVLNHNSDEPIYRQLAVFIEKMINSGELKPGDKIPSESEFCKRFDVSRITVRQALNMLTQKDLIYSVHGKGSFVKVAEIRQELSRVVRFGEVLNNQSQKGYTSVFQYDSGRKNSRATDALETENYFNLFMIGHIQNIPAVYYKSYILDSYKVQVYSAAKKMEINSEAFSTLDIYDRLGIKIKRISQNVTAVNGNGKSAEILNMNNQALLRLESIYYLEDGTAIEYKTAYYRSDIYSFQLNREIKD